jgi:hypothetical protein
MYAYTNDRGRAVGADLAGAIRVLSGRGYADFHAGTNFAITEFSEVRLRRQTKGVELPAEVGVQELVETLVVGREEPL